MVETSSEHARTYRIVEQLSRLERFFSPPLAEAIVTGVTNLAARLCGEARTGQILLTARVVSEVEALVETEDIGALTLEGFARPVPAVSLRPPRPA